jgi:hypothetical protein
MKINRLPTLLLVAVLVWVRPTGDGLGRCQTSLEPTLGRAQTLCNDGTRATSYWNRTLERWETTLTESPRPSCTWQRRTPRPWGASAPAPLEGRCQ